MSDNEWQAIGTVPPDKAVLVYSRRWGTIIAEFSSELGAWRSRMQCPVSLKTEDDGLTHWMPLPAKPGLPDQPAPTEPPAIVYRTRIVAH